jgi:hypothetical protein
MTAGRVHYLPVERGLGRQGHQIQQVSGRSAAPLENAPITPWGADRGTNTHTLYWGDPMVRFFGKRREGIRKLTWHNLAQIRPDGTYAIAAGRISGHRCGPRIRRPVSKTD